MTDLGKSFIMSSLRVADRISSLIRNEEKSKVSARAEVFRVAVAIAPPSASASGEPAAIGLNFKLGLVDKKTSEHVHFVIRSWPIIKQIVLFIRGVAPKLDVPPLPVEAPNAPPAVVAEDRRKYLQTYVNAALQNPTVSNLKEFADLIGLSEYTALHAHDAPAVQPSPSQIAAQAARKEGSVSSVSTAETAAGDVSSPRASKQPPSSPPATSKLQAQTNTASQLEECFRVMDVGGAGYLTPEDMKQFIDVVAELTPRVRPAVTKLLKDSNPFAASDFATLIQTLARDCGESGAVEKWIEGYHNVVFSEIYSALGSSSTGGSGAHVEPDSGSEERSYDPVELRTLTFVLRVSGVRNITESEIEQEQGLSLPVSLDDFCRLMNCLCRVVAFDDLIRSLERSARGDRSKMLHLVCRSAASASGKRSAVKALQECIAELGGGARRLGKCGNCEAAEQRARSLKLQVSELEADNDSLRARIAELEDQLAVKEQSFTAEAERATLILSLEEEVARLQDSAQEWQNRAQALDERVKDLEMAEEDTAQQPQGAAAAAAALPTTAVYELHPDHLGSEANDTLIDLPGPLTVRVSATVHSRRPRQLLFDVFFTGRLGCEYISLRDDRGQRAFGCRAEDGRLYPSLSAQKLKSLVTSTTVTPVELPPHRWLRCVVTLDWAASTYTFAVNHVTVWRNLEFRDPTASRVDVLDVYPRHEVLYCYANVRLTE